jgi:hypothetical protein
MFADFGAKGAELLNSEAALEAQYQLRNKGNKAGRMAGALGAKFHLAQQEAYSHQYYEWTEVEIIDVFFRRCNKARNQLERYLDTIDFQKKEFLEAIGIPESEGGSIALCLEAMIYLFAGAVTSIADFKVDFLTEQPFVKVTPPPILERG